MFKKLYALFMEVFPGFYEMEKQLTLEPSGFMDIKLEVLDKQKQRILVSLGASFKHPSGEVIEDSDMHIAIYPAQEELEALSMQNCFGCHVVYEDIDDPKTVNHSAKTSLNIFLEAWLSKLKE